MTIQTAKLGDAKKIGTALGRVVGITVMAGLSGLAVVLSARDVLAQTDSGGSFGHRLGN